MTADARTPVTPRTRRAFTLVELLVVIAIIAVLVGLLLSAVQKVREAANRSRCFSNLKQFSLALHNYESAHGRYPFGGRGYGWCGSLNADARIYNQNGVLLLLPFLEQPSLYGQFKLDQAVSSTTEVYAGPPAGAVVGDPAANGNAALAATILPVLICPSDNGSPVSKYEPTPGLPGARTSYDFIADPTDYPYSGCNRWRALDANTRPMFGENSTTRAVDVVDGLSNTLAAGETPLAVNNGDSSAWAFRSWCQPGIAPTCGFNDWGFPGSPHAYAGARFGVSASWGFLGSLHPGGANVAFGDGSIRFLRETTPATTLERLENMADGEVIGELP